jgi:hypothetical protein
MLKEDPARSVEQNAKFHAMCRDFARQMTWAGRKWSEDDWKKIFLGGKFGQTFVQSPFGHSIVVVNNKRSSKLKEWQFIELLGEMEAFGAEHGIDWSDDDSE